MVKDGKGGGFDPVGGNTNGLNFQRLQKVYVQNNTGDDLDIGDIVFIDGLPNEIDYDKLKIEYLSCGFILSGVAYDSNHKDRLSAITLEPIKQDGIGEVYFPGLLAVNIYNYNSEYKYARIQDGIIKSAQGGEYKVIGASSANGESISFGYVLQNEGHLIGRTQSKISGPGGQTNIIGRFDEAVLLENVKCPMLQGDGVRYETISAYTNVVVSRSFITGEWEIIEAHCSTASAAPLPGEGEDEGADPEFQDDPNIVDEPSVDSPEGEE